jgi:hypothetical protein
MPKSDYKRLRHALRAMRRAARLFLANGDVGHLNAACAWRDVASAYRFDVPPAR